MPSMSSGDIRATSFTKSLENRRTEKMGLSILTRDPRFQAVGALTKRRIIDRLGVSENYGIQTFDLVMTPLPAPPVTPESVETLFEQLTLVEMKVTMKAIRDSTLNGFFFGATERERAMAAALGDKYRFAFVVLSHSNDYGLPFAVLLTLEELERRTRPWRVQYQVNFRTDMKPGDVEASQQVVVLGATSDSDPPDSA
jgi:hypothetical protein